MWAMREGGMKKKWISDCYQQWKRWRRWCNDIRFIEIKASSGFPGGSVGKEYTCNAGDLGSVPGLGRFPGGGHGNPLSYSSLENPHGQRSLVGYSPRGRKESGTTERLSRKQHKAGVEGSRKGAERLKDGCELSKRQTDVIWTAFSLEIPILVLLALISALLSTQPTQWSFWNTGEHFSVC